MTTTSPTRRDILAASVAASVVSLLPERFAGAADNDAIRPFRFDAPEDQLVDLRRRLAAIRWPDRETVADETQGVRLATIQQLAHYWERDYD